MSETELTLIDDGKDVAVRSNVERCYNEEGNVAVLYSPGYGSGWSTYNSDHKELFIFDKHLVQLAQRNAGKDEVEKYLQEKTGEEYLCLLGWRDIDIAWVKPGACFTVSEYDGNESLELLSDLAVVA